MAWYLDYPYKGVITSTGVDVKVPFLTSLGDDTSHDAVSSINLC
jgi:hypothetical protein